MTAPQVVDLAENPEGFRSDVKKALLDLTDDYNLPGIPPDTAREAREIGKTLRWATPAGSRRRAFSSVTRQLAHPRSFPIEISRQVSQHGLAGFFGLSKRFKGRAGHPDGARILRERAPRCYIAGRSMKAGTAAALITDHEGKAVAARVPYFHVVDGINDAGELHSHSTAVAILDAHGAQAALIVIPPAAK
jgi:hypothetical protein